MTTPKPRIVVPSGDAALSPSQLAVLREVFDVVTSIDGTTVIADRDREAYLLQPASSGALACTMAVQHIGEGLGIVRRDGSIAWADPRLARMPAAVRAQFNRLCTDAFDVIDPAAPDAGDPVSDVKFVFQVGATHYDLVVSPAEHDDAGRVASVVGVIWDVTETRSLQSAIDAIDAAGAELMKIEAESIRQLSARDRLKLLEDKITHYVNDLLHFDNFEIRLLNRKTRQLELVTAIGISPLKIGEVMYARPEDNGISGYVATTGQSYYCPDTSVDPRYREGLDNAASSLTVPLCLQDQVIGVFNIESKTRDAFDDNDRQFAEIFARYIAMALNILDLLIVERYTTNQQVSQTMLGEISGPLEQVTRLATDLRSKSDHPEINARLDDIVAGLNIVRRTVQATSSGPNTILGTDSMRAGQSLDKTLAGTRVLVADDEPAIREGVQQILAKMGCEVTVCRTGGEAITAIGTPEKHGAIFDLIISDIKMPDYNGYEVFRAARRLSELTPVILMTGFGYDPHHSIVRASQEGLHSFLFKPFKAEQLVDEARKAVLSTRIQTNEPV